MDAVVFAVGNAKQAAHYYSTAFGMRRIAYRGPETGYPDEAVHVSSRAAPGSSSAARPGPGPGSGMRVAAHGDGVADLALEVSSAEEAYYYAVAHGARGLEAPHLLEDDYGKVVVAAIATYGDTRHTLVERSGYGSVPARVRPGGTDRRPGRTRLLHQIDHCVGNVELGKMDAWVEFYRGSSGFANMRSSSATISPPSTPSLMSKVMSDGNGRSSSR